MNFVYEEDGSRGNYCPDIWMINDDMGGGSRTKNGPEIDDDDDDDDDYYYVDDDDNPKGQFGDTDCVETCWVVLCKDVKKYGDR